MSDKKNTNSAAVSVAELTTAYNNAVAAKTDLPATATADEIKAADDAVLDAKKALDDAISADKAAADKAPGKEKKVKVKFLLSPTGKFNLAYVVGETASFPAPQAQELVEAKYAEFVK